MKHVHFYPWFLNKIDNFHKLFYCIRNKCQQINGILSCSIVRQYNFTLDVPRYPEHLLYFADLA